MDLLDLWNHELIAFKITGQLLDLGQAIQKKSSKKIKFGENQL